MTIDRQALADANEKYSNADIMTILRWTYESFGNDVGMTTAFGYSGLVLLYHALQIMPDMKVYFIDTGFHFPETLQFCEWITNEWSLNLEVIKPHTTKEELYSRIGDEPYRINADLCCMYCKMEPLLRVIHTKKAWLSGIRRDQSESRAGIDVIELDGRGVIQISPMANWTGEQTWQYIKENDLPYHPLHDKSYPSIGCAPCTLPVKNGGNERDGRWPFMQKMECGIHLKPR